MSKKRNFFDEKSLLSTPDPIFSSSMSQNKEMSHHAPHTDALLSDNSLGILSLNSDDISFGSSKLLSSEREKALKAIKKYEAKASELTSLPSRFLRRCELSEGSTLGLHSDSTISECDLLPDNSSTPRESALDNLEEARECLLSPRLSAVSHSLANNGRNVGWSMGAKLKNLASSINTDDSYKMEHIYSQVRESLHPQSSFKSGEEAFAKLQEDELSWRREKDLPAQFRDFSIDFDEAKLSMGDFFKEKSDDLSNIMAKSPEKHQKPIALLDTTTSSRASTATLDVTTASGEDESFSVSRIAEILKDQTAGKALDCFLSQNKKEKEKKSPIAAKVMNEEKENVDTLNIQSSISPENSPHNSLRSASSLSSLPNGKLPIATTKTELIWGCIRLGKSVSQEFVLRNRSDSRVGLKCTVKNPSFRLSKEGLELNFLSELKLQLYPYESRPLTVTFIPSTVGAAVDDLKFTSIDPKHKQTVSQFIRLYGYGGHGTVTIHNIIKDTAGKFLLNLGNIDNQEGLTQVFVVKNRGTLAAFACFHFIPNGMYSFSEVRVCPKRVVLLPDQEKEITVSYVPQKKDRNYIKSKLNNSVIEMGKIQLVSGTEVNRGRLRKLCLKAKAKGQEIKQHYHDITEKIEGEAMPSDLKHLKESLGSSEEIFKCLNTEEITITVEQDVDYTITGQLTDETTMFLSLCEYTHSDTFNQTESKECCHVEPTRIILTPPDKMKDMIFVTNNSNKTLYFELSVAPEGLHLNPRDGTIAHNKTAIIEVHYTKLCSNNTMHKVRIMVDNESYEVDVKIMFRNRMKC